MKHSGVRWGAHETFRRIEALEGAPGHQGALGGEWGATIKAASRQTCKGQSLQSLCGIYGGQNGGRVGN